jgi:Mg2+/Co2+ transporter CorB
MNRKNPYKARDARRWQAKVREAEAELAHRIATIEAAPDRTRAGTDRLSTLTRLRQRLGRIIDRYGSILD